MTQIIERQVDLTQCDLPTAYAPILRRVLAARGVNSSHQLDYSLKNLASYHSLSHIEKAVQLLAGAITKKKRIVIVADYDADGATSCTLAIRALRSMGADYVDFIVPNREKHGYGLTETIVQLSLPLEPDLLITVDNGVASVAGVKVAKDKDIRVLVTDHHLPPDVLPEADAIVNPNLVADTFPSKHLAGVGVIFYVMLALRAFLRERNWFNYRQIPVPNLADLLDLVALGTVADVVQLDYNNRILVAQGLARIRANQCCEGIRALLNVSKREQSTLVTSDLGFAIGPRLNAAGRMDDMRYGILCLLSDTAEDGLYYAQLLDNFNQERRFVEAEMQQEALNIIASHEVDKADLPKGMCLLDENWHQGVIGIVAARIKEKYHRPVIVFTKDDDTFLKGSARSIQGVHIRDILDSIATQHPNLITKFGGHAMAAGLSLPRDNFVAFQEIFAQEVAKEVSDEDLQGSIFTDGELAANDFNLQLAEQLRTLTPWGQGFPEPIFSGRFEILERRILKGQHLKMTLRPTPESEPIEAIAFNITDESWENGVTEVELAYKLSVNFYRGVRSLQLMCEYVYPC